MDDLSAKTVKYLNMLLNESKITSLPRELKDIDGFSDIDRSIRTLRESLYSIGNGMLSDTIDGHGYLIGTVKNLQATLRNFVWHTRAISDGKYQYKVQFLGEFSDAFNSMARTLERTIKEVNDAKALFELIFTAIPDATVIMGREDFKLFDCNDAFSALFSCSKDSLRGANTDNLLFAGNDSAKEKFKQSLEVPNSSQHLTLEISPVGRASFYALFSSVIINIKGESFILSVIKDITALKNLENKLRESEQLHKLLADNATDVIWTMDLSGRFLYISPSIEKLRGYTPLEVMQQTKEELVCPESRASLELGLRAANRRVKNNQPIGLFRGDIEQPCKSGGTVWTDVTVSGIYNKGNQFLALLGVSRDITERKRMEDEIKRLSVTDSLTQLYNRFKMDTALSAQMKLVKGGKSSHFSIILFDIDNFKRVNDTYGHIIGDKTLKTVARIISSEVGERGIMGRWGGEEFLIILPDMLANEAYNFAELLRKRIAEHDFAKAGKITASFGVAEANNKINETKIILNADKAMYEAKNAGKNCTRLFKNKTEKHWSYLE